MFNCVLSKEVEAKGTCSACLYSNHVFYIVRAVNMYCVLIIMLFHVLKVVYIWGQKYLKTFFNSLVP